MKLLKGLNTDVAHVDQPGSTYRRSRNMILDDLAGALSVEKGTAPISYFDNNIGGQRSSFENMAIVGQFKVPGDRILFAIKNRDATSTLANDERIVEVAEATTGDDTLITVAAGPHGTFYFDFENPTQGVGYVNAANELILTWTNGTDSPYWINATTYQNSEAPNLVFPEATFPMARPLTGSATDRSGEILGGNWSFMIAYEVVDGTDNLTQYGPSMGAFRIGNTSTVEDKTYKTSIGMKFYNMDQRYNYARVYGVRSFNGTETVYYVDRLRISGPTKEFRYIGQNQSVTNVPATDALFIPRANYTTAETLTVSDDRLFLANLTGTAMTEAEGRTIANQVTMHWTVDLSGATAESYDAAVIGSTTARTKDITSEYLVEAIQSRSNATLNDSFRQCDQRTPSGLGRNDSHGLLGGFMPDEVYSFYISFLLKDGQWSQGFHIPGGGNAGTFQASQSGLAIQAQLDSNIATSGTYNLKLGGRTGWVSNDNELYDSSYTEGITGTLANGKVRHHRMPTVDQMFRSTQTSLGGDDSVNAGVENGTYPGEWANHHLGVFASNVIISDDVAAKVQGFKIFYAKANINDRRVKGYVPTWSWHRYANLDSGDSLFGTKNEAVNALRVYDPYILQQTPADVDDWSMTEVYKNMSFVSSPLTISMQTGTVNDFAFLPANTNNGTFNNELRENVLALKLDASATAATGWLAQWPGYVPGTSIGINGGGNTAWHSSVPYDHVPSDYPMRTASENGFGDNFASKFGGVHGTVDDMPDKTSSLYPVTFTGTAYLNAETGAAAGITRFPYRGPGNMGSYSALTCEYDDYYQGLSTQTLVGTNDLVATPAAGTFRSNQAVHGGDTFITPVVVEFMAHDTGLDPNQEPVNLTDDFEMMSKITYFTYSHLLLENNDMASTETLDFFSEFKTSVGSDTGVLLFEGQFLNDRVFGDHFYKTDDSKAPLAFNESALVVSSFPNRIIRSAKQNYETTQYAWGAFAVADYYDNALGKEEIRNLEDYKGELIIHHQNAIFKTRSKFTFDAGGTDVFVGTGDIFQAPPVELFPDAAGYAGIAHWADSLQCRMGYVWVDREGRRVYKLDSGLEELSANGMRDYFRDDFCQIAGSDDRVTDWNGGGGYAIGYDPQFDRLLFTGIKFGGDSTTRTIDGETISYSARNGAWASMHDHRPQMYFQSYSNLYFLNEYNMRTITVAGGNQTMMYKLNNANQGVCAPYLIAGQMPVADANANLYYDASPLPTLKSSVDVVFNMGGAKPKVWQNFNWITRSGDGEGELLSGKFDSFRVYNDYQISAAGDESDIRKVDNRWNFNEFRDVATGSGSFFAADGFSFDASRISGTKKWYEQGRFISEYAIIRLETLNTEGDSLYLTDVSATARLAQR